MRVRARKKGGSQKKISGTCFEKGAGLFCRRATRKQKRCPSLLSGRTPKAQTAVCLSEFTFDDFAQHLGDVKSGGTHLLGNEAGFGHTRSRVDFE